MPTPESSSLVLAEAPGPALAPAAGAEARSRPGARAGRDLRWTDLPRWLLLAALIYAPWAYGCTRDWALHLLNGALFAIAGLWVVGCLVTRTWPRLHPVPLLAVLLLLGQGWWMTLNAGWSYDAEFQPHARPSLLPSWPQAVDYAAAFPVMTSLSALLGAVLLACEMGASRRWRRRLWLTMAVAGCSVIALGLGQKLTQAPGIFWQAEGHAPTFFGPYRYHANAGSFINIVWPLLAALLACAVRRGDSRPRLIAWSVGLAIAIAGAMANTSRASGLITLIFLGAWMLWMGVRVLRRREDTDPAVVLGVTLLLVAAAVAVLAAGGFDVGSPGTELEFAL